MNRLTVTLLFAFLQSCAMQKNYTTTKNGNEIILNGIVNIIDLNNAKQFPWFYSGLNKYKANTEAINKLKIISNDIGILIIAATWCSDTQEQLPKFVAIINQLGIKQNQIQIIMVDRNKHCNTFNTKSIQLSYVPTFIFYKNKKEIGRIIEAPNLTLEEDMVSIFKLN